MCIKKKIVNCLFTHEAHRIHMNSFKRVRALQIELEFGSVGFWGEGKTGVPGEKPLGAKERTKTCMASTPGVEPGPHCLRDYFVLDCSECLVEAIIKRSEKINDINTKQRARSCLHKSWLKYSIHFMFIPSSEKQLSLNMEAFLISSTRLFKFRW